MSVKKMLKSFSWNDEDKSIRGCFISTVITFVYIVLIVLGAAFSKIAVNLKEMESLMIGFFVISFGVWTGKKVYEYSKMSGVNDILKKFGTNLDEVKILKQNGGNDGTVSADPDAAARAAEREAAK